MMTIWNMMITCILLEGFMTWIRCFLFLNFVLGFIIGLFECRWCHVEHFDERLLYLFDGCQKFVLIAMSFLQTETLQGPCPGFYLPSTAPSSAHCWSWSPWRRCATPADSPAVWRGEQRSCVCTCPDRIPPRLPQLRTPPEHLANRRHFWL